MTRKKRLGRGLEALLGVSGDKPSNSNDGDNSVALDEPTTFSIAGRSNDDDALTDERSYSIDNESFSQFASPVKEENDIVKLSVYEVDKNPFQPRREFSESEIDSLSESLKDHDLLQPILVRKVGNRYQLISGERRLRAATKAGWTTIPAQIREADDRLVAELAIVENLQRKDLNAIEKAKSFKRYIDQHGCTQEELAGRLKIDRSTLTNLIRLLELPELVQQSLQQDSISAGHARSLLPLGDKATQVAFCNRIQAENWSVRQTERQVTEYLSGDLDEKDASPKPAKSNKNPQIKSLMQDLKRALGTPVDIKPGTRGKGKIVLHYENPAEFERIFALLSGQNEPDKSRRVA